VAATDIVFTGAYFLANKYADVVIGGLDCGSILVDAFGNVTVPLSSNSALSGTYLQSLDVGPWDRNTYGDATTEITLQVEGGGRATVYVPVTIGFSFYSAGQGMRPTAENATKSAEGSGVGKLRRVWSYGVLVTKTQGLNLGTSISNQEPAPLKDDAGNSIQPYQLFNGVVYNEVEDNDSFNGQLCWTIPRPYPCIINSLTGYLETKDR